MWDSNCLQVNQFHGAGVGIIRLCQPWPHPGHFQPAARDHWFADPSVTAAQFMSVSVPNLSQKGLKSLNDTPRKNTNVSKRPKVSYVYNLWSSQSFKVKNLELGTDRTLCAQGLYDRFSSLWPLSCVVRFPGVEAHISTRDATVSGIRGRQGPDREAGAAAGVNRWGADCRNVANIFMF